MTCAWMETSSAETGLVRDDEVGIHDNGARDADPLALAAGKLVWVAVRVLADEADELQHLIDLFINDLLVALALDDKPLRNDFADRHAGIQRRDRVLENHLNLCDELCLFRTAQLFPVLPAKTRFLRAGGRRDPRLIRLAVRFDLRGRVFFYHSPSGPQWPPKRLALRCDLCSSAVFASAAAASRAAFVMAPDLTCASSAASFCLAVRARLPDRFEIGTLSRRDTDTLEIDVAGGDVIQLDNGASGRRFAAAGLPRRGRTPRPP